MKYVFYSVACICLFSTIAYAIYLTGSAAPLWAIVLVAWMFASMPSEAAKFGGWK